MFMYDRHTFVAKINLNFEITERHYDTNRCNNFEDDSGKAASESIEDFDIRVKIRHDYRRKRFGKKMNWGGKFTLWFGLLGSAASIISLGIYFCAH